MHKTRAEYESERFRWQKKAKEILRTWDTEDLIEDAVVRLNTSQLKKFVKENE